MITDIRESTDAVHCCIAFVLCLLLVGRGGTCRPNNCSSNYSHRKGLGVDTGLTRPCVYRRIIHDVSASIVNACNRHRVLLWSKSRSVQLTNVQDAPPLLFAKGYPCLLLQYWGQHEEFIRSELILFNLSILCALYTH